jgi:hypothetical protein
LILNELEAQFESKELARLAKPSIHSQHNSLLCQKGRRK